MSAALVDRRDGFQLWSERYDREMADVFDIQDEIVVGARRRRSRRRCSAARRHAVRRPTDNLEAYEFYLKGRHYWHQRSPSTLRLAIQSFEQAIALDADYALALRRASPTRGRSTGRTGGCRSRRASRRRSARSSARWRSRRSSPKCSSRRRCTCFYFDPHWRRLRAVLRARDPGQPALVARARVPRRVPRGHVSPGGSHGSRPRRRSSSTRCRRSSTAPRGWPRLPAATSPPAAHAARRALELQPDFLMGAWLLAIALDDKGRSTRPRR